MATDTQDGENQAGSWFVVDLHPKVIMGFRV